MVNLQETEQAVSGRYSPREWRQNPLADVAGQADKHLYQHRQKG